MTNMPTLQTITDTFSILDDWEDRYAYLIDLGRNLPPFPEEQKTDENIVQGCTSQVWMVLNIENDVINITSTSDAHIVRGLIALVIAVYNNKSLSDIKNIDIDDIFNDMGLSEHLSPNRRSGFFAMVEKIKNAS
jgi:cysteine desulfuration protein SufE